MSHGREGILDYTDHNGHELLIYYTFYPGRGSMRGEAPSVVEIDSALDDQLSDYKGSLSKLEMEEIEQLVYEKEEL